MKNKWGAAIQIGAVYVGTIVGAGFATGREIVEFFTSFGFLGILGILLSGCLLIFSGVRLMTISVQINAKSYQEINVYLFGKLFGNIFNIVLLFMLFGVCAVMLSGAGAVFEEQLHTSKILGVVITIILSVSVMALGIKGIFAVNSFVVPMLLFFSFFMLFKSIFIADFLNQLLYIPVVENGWKVAASPLAYAALNIVLAQAVLVPIASEINDLKIVKWGGIIGGSALTIILLSSHLTLMMLPNVEDYHIPIATMVKNFAPELFWVYILIIYGEIFTSVIGNVFGLERQINIYVALPKLPIIFAIFLITFTISFFNYSSLISYLYPLFGYIGVVFIIMLIKKPQQKLR
ncbi:hypothetical protein J9303_02615 [Bacillaceae bacterium Marseille-Q3522]|nr:hypothetical protein [Bacillaceae bacterium Marseille-Q3522]